MKCKRRYDIVVVGAGPVGSYTAYLLAQKSFKVGIVEKKDGVGDGVLCTGVIGTKAFDRFDLPGESVVTKIDSAVFFSPSGQKLLYEPNEVFACVVDRDVFDQRLLRKAVESGVDAFFRHRVSDIEYNGSYCSVKTRGSVYHARAVVVATGVDYCLHDRLGFGRPDGFLYGSQVDLSVPSLPSRVEVHIGQDFAPGSFGWIVPFRNGSSRIGVIVQKEGKVWLRNLIAKRVGKIPPVQACDIRVKPIACGPVKRSSKDRVLVVGEAAGQVKTTTGGGIYYGLLCAEIAADCIEKNLRSGCRLDDYEVAWRSALAAELDIGRNLRSLALKLSDQDIERLFTFAKQNRFWVELLIPRIDFDYHSDVIFYCMKSFSHLLQLNH
ncbi:NAD(P)/FAD-dependent oxidoreductase [candidate division WOR-3 bacterium]|nr:NAD(P)/FAD-dependent oxidoreductase [candidate division WOR-3 bacterium]